MGRMSQEFVSVKGHRRVIEKRRFERYRIKIPAMIEWTTQEGSRTLFLETENISAQGVFFPMGESISPVGGLRMHFILDFPGSNQSEYSGETVLITVTGKILRDDTSGIAVSFEEDYKIRTVYTDIKPSRLDLH